MAWIEGTPNPGSDAAIDKGCTCPVMDNNHGRWAPWPPNGWWQAPGCPVHMPETAQAVEEAAPVRRYDGLPLVVVPRRVKRERGRRKTANGWTLHKEDCFQLGRTMATILPAPAVPYPDTVPCAFCKPGGKDQERPAMDAKTLNGKPRTRHLNKYRDVVIDGDPRVMAECQLCGINADGPTVEAARTKVYRLHQAAPGVKR